MSEIPFCRIPPLARITERLPRIFPEGIQHRNYMVRDTAARTVFVLFYAGAIAGAGRWIRPNQVTRMTNDQARMTGDAEREAWIASSLRSGEVTGVRWYADNTREPIRDETLRGGFVPVGGVVERRGIPTNSSKPKYALAADFAELFLCSESAFIELAEEWRGRQLTAGARARITLVRRGAVAAAGSDKIEVRFPTGEVRQMSPGPSSFISKAVIEVFATTFLQQPGVIFLSESRDKVVARDDELAREIGLEIPAQVLLPDIVLVDLGPVEPLLVFVEVVATDGPVTERRKESLAELTRGAGFDAENVAFVTALSDKGSGVYRKVASDIAWGTFVWFASQPEHIVANYELSERPQFLSEFLRPGRRS